MFNTTRQNRFKVGLYAALFSITTMGSSQLLGQNQDIQTLLEPARSSQVLAWENISSQNVVRWRVDILKKEIQNGITSYIPQIQFFQDKSYLGIDKQYMNENYYYKVYGLDAGDNVIVVGNGPIPVAPGISTERICEQKCKGSNFAYQVEQYEVVNSNNANSSGVFLKAAPTVAWVDPVTSMVTPYFQYISAEDWDDANDAGTNPWTNDPYVFKEIRFDLTALQTQNPGKINFVKDAQNNGLTGWIVGVEKTMNNIGESPCNGFNDYSGINTVLLANQFPCNPQLADFASTFNTYNTLNYPTTNTSLPTLMCDSDPNDFLMSVSGSLFTTDPTKGDDDLPDALDGWHYYHTWYYDGYWDDGEPGDGVIGTNKGVLSFEELNEELQIKSASNYTDGITPADFIQFEFQLVGDPNSSIIYYPSDITLEDGSMSFSNVNLPSGLYTMNVIHSDFTLYSIYFESLGAEGTLNNTLSNYLNTNIYQVPIIEYNYNVSLKSSKNMIVLYQAFDLDGNLLLEDEFELLDGEEIIYHAQLNPALNYPSNIVVNKFTCVEDGSTQTIQTILSTL